MQPQLSLRMVLNEHMPTNPCFGKSGLMKFSRFFQSFITYMGVVFDLASNCYVILVTSLTTLFYLMNNVPNTRMQLMQSSGSRIFGGVKRHIIGKRIAFLEPLSEAGKVIGHFFNHLPEFQRPNPLIGNRLCANDGPD